MAASKWTIANYPSVDYDGTVPIVGNDSRRRTLIVSWFGFGGPLAVGPKSLAAGTDAIYWVTAGIQLQIQYSEVGTLVCSEWYLQSNTVNGFLNITECLLI